MAHYDWARRAKEILGFKILRLAKTRTNNEQRNSHSRLNINNDNNDKMC